MTSVLTTKPPIRGYFASRALALTGGAVAEAILPLIVVVTLDGGSTAVGAVTATTIAVSLLTRVPLSAWVDARSRQITLQAFSQVVSAGTACLVPLLWVLDVLNTATLLASVIVIVLAKTLVSSCGHSTVNQLAEPEQRVRAIGTLNSISSAADVIGQSGGPALTRVMPAPLVLLIDAVMNLASAAIIWRLRRFEHGRGSDVDEAVADGAPDATTPVLAIVRRVVGQPPIWLLWLSGVVGSLIAPVTLVYLIDELDVPPALVGVLYAFGAAGGITGGLLAHRVLARLGMRPLITVSCLLSSTAVFCLVAAADLRSGIYPLVIAFELLAALSGTLLVAAVYGTLQASTEVSEVSRVMSVASTGMEGLALLGIGAGVAIAAVYSEYVTIVVTAVCYLVLGCAAAWVRPAKAAEPELN